MGEVDETILWYILNHNTAHPEVRISLYIIIRTYRACIYRYRQKDIYG